MLSLGVPGFSGTELKMVLTLVLACNPDVAPLADVSPPVAAVATPAPFVAPEPVVSPEPVVVEEPVPATLGDGLTTITVRPGESLDAIARMAGTTVEHLAEVNHVGVKSVLRAGDALVVPVSEELDARRESAFDERLALYLENRGGLVGLTSREVRTGDTAWGIAREERLPLWVLAAFNRTTRLESIGAGDTLYLPILGDDVVLPDTAEG